MSTDRSTAPPKRSRKWRLTLPPSPPAAQIVGSGRSEADRDTIRPHEPGPDDEDAAGALCDPGLILSNDVTTSRDYYLRAIERKHVTCRYGAGKARDIRIQALFPLRRL